MVNIDAPLVSIIIRTKNEERWISSCLRAVYSQSYQNIEVVLVDNKSTDNTVVKAMKYPIKVVNIDDFIPGKAINDGIRASSGEYIVCLSGHCVPTSNEWLSNLVADLGRKDIAGVYGRQEPLSFTSDIDKRDLHIVFGLDRKIQIKDSFFHNANSALRRDMWEKYPFDENVTNIEDRVWGEKVISEGYKIVYEPMASVYHWHGIHQDLNAERARNIVRILESLDGIKANGIHVVPDDLHIVAIIPIRDNTRVVNGKTLLEYTVLSAKKSKYIEHLVVSTDNEEVAALSKELGVDTVQMRPLELSEDYIGVFDVLSYSVGELEENDMHFDIVVMLEEIYPFRDQELIDNMVVQHVYNGHNTVVAALCETRDIWLQGGEYTKLLELNEYALMPKSLKESRAFVSMPGLCCVTYPELIRNNSIFNGNVGIYEVDNPISSITVRKSMGTTVANQMCEFWELK